MDNIYKKIISSELLEEMVSKQPTGSQYLSIPRILAGYVSLCGIKFTVNGKIVDPYNIYSPEMFMPVVGLEALRLWHNLGQAKGEDLSKSLQITFAQTPDGLFPLSAHTALIKRGCLLSTLRLLCFNLANRRVFALKENESIELQPFIDTWRNEIDWNSAVVKPLPVPEVYDGNFLNREFKNRYANYELDRLKVKEVTSPFQ